MIALDDIRRSFQGRISLNEPLARYTTFRIGGAADIYLEPLGSEDAVALISYLRSEGIPFLTMGNGSNLLISDDGVEGAVVNLEAGFNYVQVDDKGVITAGAGIRLAKFVDFCISEGRGGSEMLAGIPGTLGGAVIMNAGAYGGEISDYMVSVELIRGDRLMKLNRSDAGFAYRTSNLQGDVILEASFDFPPGLPEEMKKSRRETMLKRNGSQPVQWPNAGSIFKNPPGDYAARLIEAAGLKGRRVGNAEVSELHANFIINLGDVRASEVLELIDVVRHDVHKHSGVMLALEIKLVGFSPDEVRRHGGTPMPLSSARKGGAP